MSGDNVCRVEGCGKLSKGFTCSMHRMRMSKFGSYETPEKLSTEERFWSKVAPAGPDECWIWRAYKSKGYGHFRLGGSNIGAHRFAWLSLRGEIPAGLDLDHLCRTPSCVNPYHLDPVTKKVNQNRQKAALTGCRNGHEWSAENTRITPNGSRACRTCGRERMRRVNAAKRAAAMT